MHGTNHLAVEHNGERLAIAHQQQLFVHLQSSQEPLWRKQFDDSLVSIASTPESLVTLETNGQLTYWDWTSGSRLGELQIGFTPTAMYTSPSELIAVSGIDRLVLIHRLHCANPIEIPSICSASLSIDGSLLSIGTDRSEFIVHDIELEDDFIESYELGRLVLNDSVTSICWNAAGFWFAAAGNTVWRIAPEGANPTTFINHLPATADRLSCSRRGSLVGFTTQSKRIAVLNVERGTVAATVEYFDRQITGLELGPSQNLIVSLDSGDANLIDLTTEEVSRTDPHPGHPRNRWQLKLSVKPHALPSKDQEPSWVHKSDLFGETKKLQEGLPGWMAPLLGTVMCAFMFAKQAKHRPIEELIGHASFGAILGFIGGMCVWFWDHRRRSESRIKASR